MPPTAPDEDPGRPGALPANGGIAGWLASWWRIIHFGALALVMALTPSTYDRRQFASMSRQICLTAWQVLPWFTLLSTLLSLVLIRIVVVTAQSYGLSQYALEMVVRVLVVELIPLFAALFVALRSGTAIAAELTLMNAHGDFAALRRAGLDPVRCELMPRVVAMALAVVALAAVSGIIALVLAYLGVYGISPWGLESYTRTVGRVFDLTVAGGLILKTLFFSLAVAVIPITTSLEPARADGGGPLLGGMARLFLLLVVIEGASLTIRYV